MNSPAATNISPQLSADRRNLLLAGKIPPRYLGGWEKTTATLLWPGRDHHNSLRAKKRPSQLFEGQKETISTLWWPNRDHHDYFVARKKPSQMVGGPEDTTQLSGVLEETTTIK